MGRPMTPFLWLLFSAGGTVAALLFPVHLLLNGPSDAESICLDILRIDPENQKALVVMLLAVTDQFDGFNADAGRAMAVLHRLHDEYQRAYYAGIINERRAKAHFKKGGP